MRVNRKAQVKVKEVHRVLHRQSIGDWREEEDGPTIAINTINFGIRLYIAFEDLEWCGR